MFDGIKILYLERSSIFQFQNGKTVLSNKIANSKLDNEKIRFIKDVNDKDNFCRAVKHYFETDFKDGIMEIGFYTARPLFFARPIFLNGPLLSAEYEISATLDKIMNDNPCFSMIGRSTIVFHKDATADQFVKVFKIILYSDLVFGVITFTRADDNVLELDDLLDTKLEYSVTHYMEGPIFIKYETESLSEDMDNAVSGLPMDYDTRSSNYVLVEDKLESLINLREEMNDAGLDEKEIEIESFQMIERLEKTFVDEKSNLNFYGVQEEDSYDIKNTLFEPLKRSLGKKKTSDIDDEWILATIRVSTIFSIRIFNILIAIDEANELQMQRIERHE